MVHHLGHPDSEQLRCDVSKEIAGWRGVVDFSAAATFVFGLHDLWSQVLLHEKGIEPWWHGNQVVSVPDIDIHHRRLEEEDKNQEELDPVVEPAEESTPVSEVESDMDEDGEDEDLEDVHHFDHNGFGVTRKSPGQATGEGKEINKKEDDDARPLKDDDSGSEMKGTIDAELDPSQYDTWLGALSSSSTNMFVRLVDAKLVGAIFLDEGLSVSIE